LYVPLLHNLNGLDYAVLCGEVGSGEPALLFRLSDEPFPFVVASILERGSWHHGKYFDDLREALDFYESLVK
jgi:hypothetical protein